MTKKSKFHKDFVHGGPERKAFDRKNVTPMNFSEDPFWDVNIKLKNLEERIHKGEISDLLIIERKFPKEEGGPYFIRPLWRGHEPLSTLYGMMEFAKDMIREGTID